jgi:hypothetical protein
MATVLVVAACAPVLGLASTTAPASATSVGQLRASIDHVAQQWFDAQATVQRLDAAIADHQQRIAELGARATKLKLVARTRAIELYTGKSTGLTVVLDGSSALDSARRVQLVERANEKSARTFESLTELTTELRSQRDLLVRQRNEKSRAAHALDTSRATLDVQLREARLLASRNAAHAANIVRNAAQALAPRVPVAPAAAPAVNAAPAPIVVPAPPPNPGVHPMHNHPFLVCTRSRESRGIYSVVSADGLYYGAYQFLRDTWDVTAIHAGRSDLVGVMPNTASEYDQDALAWALYQWQGNAPWGGRC